MPDDVIEVFVKDADPRITVVYVAEMATNGGSIPGITIDDDGGLTIQNATRVTVKNPTSGQEQTM